VLIVKYTFFLLVLTRAGSGVLLGMTKYDGDSFSFGAVLNGLTLLLAVAALAKRHRPSVLVPALIWLPYVTIASYSLLYTPDLFSGARLFMSTLTFPAMFICAFVLLRSHADIIAFFKFTIYSSVVPVFYGMFEVATKGSGFRIASTFGHPNIFAFYIVAMLVAILYLNTAPAPATSLAWRLFSRVYFVVLCGLLLVTQTRSAWIEAAFILAAYSISVNRKFLLALPLLPMALLLPSISDRLSDLSSGNEASTSEVARGRVVLNSYAWRQTLWDYALIDSENDRALGKGIGSFHYYAPSFFPLEQSADAHSAYIQSIYELGIPGLVAYVGLYLGLMLAVWQLRAASRQLTYIITAFIIGNLIINYSDNLPYYLDYNWYTWAIFGADLSWRLHRANSLLPNRRGFVAPSPRATFRSGVRT
jgi:putative inorganic carbon (HCO3(-)) transporter